LGGRGRQISEFEASLVSKVSSRIARATQRNPVSENSKKEKRKERREEKRREEKRREEKRREKKRKEKKRKEKKRKEKKYCLSIHLRALSISMIHVCGCHAPSFFLYSGAEL
jgi:amino acid permease